MRVFFSSFGGSYPLPEEVVPKSNVMISMEDFIRHKKRMKERFAKHWAVESRRTRTIKDL